MEVNTITKTSQKKFCKVIGLQHATQSSGKKHNNSATVSVIQHSSSAIKFQCPQCAKQLSTGSSLKIHLLQIHKMVSTLKPAESLICRVCNLILKSKAQLDAHIDAHYINYDSNTPSYYFCTACKLPFKKKEDLTYHNEHVCKHEVEVKPSTSCPEVYALSMKRKVKIVEGRLINKPQQNFEKDIEEDIEMIEEGSAESEHQQSKVSANEKTSLQQIISNRRKRRYVPSYEEIERMKNSNPILLKNPKSTLVNYKHSYLDDEIATLQINQETPKEVRVLSIATEQVVDRSIKCFRCNLYFKTHKDLKGHLDQWHIAELTELNQEFSKQEKMIVKHKCNGCTLSFSTVRQLTKHYFKDCKGNSKKTKSQIEKNRPLFEKAGTSSISVDCAQDDANIFNNVHSTTVEVHTSDAELLTYLQQAAGYSEKPRLEMHVANIAAIQINDRSVKCIRCNLEFPGHKELKNHLDEFHKQELSALSSKFTTDDKIEVQHKCSRCSLSFTTVRLLTKHYRDCTQPEIYPTDNEYAQQQGNNVRTSPRKLYN